jgi:sugar phosphate isomerase/epimerase
MIPALWTAIVVELPPLEAIRALAEIGWPGLELSTEHLVMVAEAPEPERLAEEVRALVDDLGVAMPQAHLLISANVAAADDAARERDLTTVMRQIELCRRMGIEVGVIHPGGERPATLEAERAERARRVESFARLAGHAARHNVALAIENVSDAARATRGALGQRTYGATIPELHELIDAVGAPNVGICYDTGHGNIQGLDMAEAVRRCGARLIALHIQDSDGTRDQHLAPMRGNIDWEHGIAALREIEFEGLFNLEIPGERGLPVDLTLRRMEGVLAATRWLLSR